MTTLAGADLTISGGVMLALGAALHGHEGLHGQLGTALRANPAGLDAVVVAIALLVVRPAQVRIPTAGVYATIASMWVFELWRFALI